MMLHEVNLPNEKLRHLDCRFSKTWVKVSMSVRAHSKERAIAVVSGYGNGRKKDHAKKDTSRQDRTAAKQRRNGEVR